MQDSVCARYPHYNYKISSTSDTGSCHNNSRSLEMKRQLIMQASRQEPNCGVGQYALTSKPITIVRPLEKPVEWSGG